MVVQSNNSQVQSNASSRFVHADHKFIPKLIANADCRRTPNPDRTWSYCQFICTGSSSLAHALRQFQRFDGEADRESSDVNYSLNADCQCSINSKAPKIHQSVQVFTSSSALIGKHLAFVHEHRSFHTVHSSSCSKFIYTPVNSIAHMTQQLSKIQGSSKKSRKSSSEVHGSL